MAAIGRYERSTNIWPGFVDALATLLMVVIFLLLIFVVAQFFLGQALSGRDSALQKLESQVIELADLLALEKRSNDNLRANLSQLSQDLQASVTARDDLKTLVADLENRGADMQGKLDEAFAQILADKGTIENQTLRIAGLDQDIAALQALRDELQSEISNLATRAAALKASLEKETEGRSAAEAALASTRTDLKATTEKLAGSETELADSRSQLAAMAENLAKTEATLEATADKLLTTTRELEAAKRELAATRQQLESSESKLAATEKDLDAAKDTISLTIDELEAVRKARASADTSLTTTRQALLEEKRISTSARAQIALLNKQMSVLREQLARLENALEISEKLTKQQKTQIFNLGKRLNAALASKVQELSRYRSEFFGRLRELLGRQRGVKIVGDRFVFQSEVLFDKGSAEIGVQGKAQLTALAATLKGIAAKIPDGIDWVLRVDGHTDNDPISTARFPSNWELSSARAIAVVRQLVADGLPPNRLVAAGFGEFQPIDRKNDEIAKRRNRRIELKLTQR